MKKILFLDDDRKRAVFLMDNIPEGFAVTWAKTAADAIAFLKNEKWDVVSLDHDLDGIYQSPQHPNTGTTVAKYIEDNRKDLAYLQDHIIIHSYNVLAAAGMMQIMQWFAPRYIPFSNDSINCAVSLATQK